MNLIIFLSIYLLLLFSIIGYGYVLNNYFFKLKNLSFGYLGFFGIFILLFISYLETLCLKLKLLYQMQTIQNQNHFQAILLQSKLQIPTAKLTKSVYNFSYYFLCFEFRYIK